jgi:hypothetical protein
MTDPQPVLVAVRQLLASAQSLLDGLLADGGASAARAVAPRGKAVERAAEPARSEPVARDATAAPPRGRRRNPAAGRAAKARWAAMSPEERAERVRKMQAARKRSGA